MTVETGPVAKQVPPRTRANPPVASSPDAPRAG